MTEPKVGMNAPCPCGSGKRYEKCCGTTSPPGSIPDPSLMERDLRGLEKLVEGQEFNSDAEVDAFFRQINEKAHILDWTPETPPERAQELVYEAIDASERLERVRLAMEALEIYQDCADAYVLLAEDAAETPEQARYWYRRGVEAGERALGPEVFARDAGHFWGFLETRPYMRARAGLASCLFDLGEHEAAIGHYRDMLRLNPGDNQGIRFKLLSCLMESNDIGAARELLGQYESDCTADWSFTRALISFIQQGAGREANKQLRRAMTQNPHVVPYLLGKRRMPRVLPDYISFGDKSEAVSYVAEFGDVWWGFPGALEWVKTTQGKR